MSAELDDPVSTARRWAAAGFSRLHVADQDAAAGLGDNGEVVRELLREVSLAIQVGGGIHDADTVRSLIDDGAEQVIIGTRGIDDPCWLREQAELFPGRMILSVDVRDGQVVSKGWPTRARFRFTDLLSEIEGAPLAGLLVIPVHREGKVVGPDLPFLEDAVRSSSWPVLASVGIGSMQDLRNLEDRGVSAVILGRALHTEAIDPRLVAEEFAE